MSLESVSIKDLRMMQTALDTALEDSYEYSRHSDPGDKRREKEAEALNRLWRIVHLEIAVRAKTKERANVKKS
jgi:hypothetical protein